MGKIAKVGDTIEWSFDDNHESGVFAGKTYRAKVAIVELRKRNYGVYAEYGQDYIPFDEAEKVIDNEK